jgi:hypothetical protein
MMNKMMPFETRKTLERHFFVAKNKNERIKHYE